MFQSCGNISAPKACLVILTQLGTFWVLVTCTRFCAPTPNFCALHPTFEKLLTGAKVPRKAQKIGIGRKTVYEINDLVTTTTPYLPGERGMTSFSPLGKASKSNKFSF